MEFYFAAYYRFLNRDCKDVYECTLVLAKSMVNLPDSESWLEYGMALGTILILFNLFLGLIVDSISERRA